MVFRNIYFLAPWERGQVVVILVSLPLARVRGVVVVVLVPPLPAARVSSAASSDKPSVGSGLFLLVVVKTGPKAR